MTALAHVAVRKVLYNRRSAMLTFLVYEDGKLADNWALREAHLVGVDDVGIKAMIRFEAGRVIAEKAAAGPAAMSLRFDVAGVGDFVLQTCLLPERPQPYILTVELARHRLMKLIAKQEDWAMFELGEDDDARTRLASAKKKFVKALGVLDDPPTADRLARQALAASIEVSEQIAMIHADTLLARRTSNGTLSRYAFGCGVDLTQTPEQLGPAIQGHIDYLCVHSPWSVIEPKEQDPHYQALDHWCEWAVKQRLPVIVGPLVAFTPQTAPQWLSVWQNDYDTVRDLLYEHVEAMVARYKNVVSLWNVVSGIHVNGHFAFSFEQMMDLTRMAVMLAKKTNPAARTLIEVTHPFGEYYASNQRSIPPIMYAEMAVQAGISFDAFGVQVLMGRGAEGRSMRDLMQVSAMLDRFNGLGKPVHVTAAAVPSEPAGSTEDGGGYWRQPWSAQVQAQWLEHFYKIALSKPFVESVAWLDLADHPESQMLGGGLMSGRNQPKPSLRKFSQLRKSLHEPAHA
jgi:hypothetical protein